jgi:hypothetical protein
MPHKLRLKIFKIILILTCSLWMSIPSPIMMQTFQAILHDGYVTIESRTWREKFPSIILPLDGGGLSPVPRRVQGWGWTWEVPPHPHRSVAKALERQRPLPCLRPARRDYAQAGARGEGDNRIIF